MDRGVQVVEESILPKFDALHEQTLGIMDQNVDLRKTEADQTIQLSVANSEIEELTHEISKIKAENQRMKD